MDLRPPPPRVQRRRSRCGGGMVSGVGVRWGEPARDAEAMGAPSTCRRPDASALSTDWGEGRRGQDQTEGAEGRRVQSGVVKRRQEQDRQEAMKGAGRRRFGLAHEALSPRPHPPRREDQFHGPEPCSLWGEEEGDWSGGHGHGAAEPDQWRGLLVGASRPARARQSKAVSVSEPCWAGLAVCVTAWGPPRAAAPATASYVPDDQITRREGR
jgi:hypothetical protein